MLMGETENVFLPPISSYDYSEIENQDKSIVEKIITSKAGHQKVRQVIGDTISPTIGARQAPTKEHRLFPNEPSCYR